MQTSWLNGHFNAVFVIQTKKEWWVPKQYSILMYISEDGSTVVTVHVVLTKLAFLHHHFDRKLLRVLRCCFRSWILRPELKADPLLRWNSCTLSTFLCDLLNQITNWDCLCHARYCIMSALMYSSALIQIQWLFQSGQVTRASDMRGAHGRLKWVDRSLPG